jgi:hypothetical protein
MFRDHAGEQGELLGRLAAGFGVVDAYYNFEESPAGAEAVLPDDAYRRLREIKALYDPDEAIISAHPVRPSAS